MQTTEIIDCFKIANKISLELENRIHQLNAANKMTLAIVHVHDNPSTLSYIENKKRRAKSLNINVEIFRINEEDIYNLIVMLNENNKYNGIIVQLPLVNKKAVDIAKVILPTKDVDGLHPFNVGLLSYGDIHNALVSCTPLGCLAIIKSKLCIKGKSILIIGRSNIVGKPLSYLLTHYNATVTLAHSYTEDLKELSNKADVVILAAGKPKYFGPSFFSKNSIIIDVGINYSREALSNIDTVSPQKLNTISGDADFHNLLGKIKAITPVPKGVGPMTVTYLMHNVIKAYARQHNLPFEDIY